MIPHTNSFSGVVSGEAGPVLTSDSRASTLGECRLLTGLCSRHALGEANLFLEVGLLNRLTAVALTLLNLVCWDGDSNSLLGV